MGTTLREIVFAIGGGIPTDAASRPRRSAARRGLRPGEASSTLPIDYDSVKRVGAIMGSGGMVVMDETHLHGGPRPLLPRVHAERVVRQVRALPHRHQAHARHPHAHHRGQGRGRGHRPAGSWRRTMKARRCAGSARRPLTPCSRPSATSATSTRPTSDGPVPGAPCSALITYKSMPKPAPAAWCAPEVHGGRHHGESKKNHVIDSRGLHQVRRLLPGLQFGAVERLTGDEVAAVSVAARRPA